MNICTYIINVCTESTDKIHVNPIIMVAYEEGKEMRLRNDKKVFHLS